MNRAVLIRAIEAQARHIDLLKRLPRNNQVTSQIEDAKEELDELKLQLVEIPIEAES